MVINNSTVAEDIIRDLMRCVQAARDGATDQSLFAMQCDLVLERASQALPGGHCQLERLATIVTPNARVFLE
jgi:hypothetical protein